MRVATLIGAGVAVALIAALVVSFGPAALLAALLGSGWPLVASAAVRGGSLVLYTQSWRVLLPQAGRPSFGRLLVLRWIGESVNALLPAAQVGGDVVRARLLVQAGVAPGPAGAALVVDVGTGAVTQAVFTLCGLALVSVAHGRDDAGMGEDMVALLALGAGALVAGALGLVVLIRNGRRWLRALPLARVLGEGPIVAARADVGADVGADVPADVSADVPADVSADAPVDMDEALGGLLGRRRVLAAGFVWHLLGWISQVAETWLALRLLGAPVSWAVAFVIESLTAAARAGAFFVPAGLGVQEGALVYLARAHGVPAEPALALGLVKRLRELVLGAPALLVWLLGERRLIDRFVQRVSRRDGPGPNARREA